MKNAVNTVYVAATSGDKITTLASSIKTAVPGVTVTDQDSLASEVTGSISSAASLANNLGKWLAIAVLDRGLPAGEPAHHVGRLPARP